MPAPGVAVNVGDLGSGNELQCSLAFEELDHLRCAVEECIHLGSVEVVAESVLQICPWRRTILHNPVGDGKHVARGPHPPARPGRCAAAGVGLLDNEYRRAAMCCGNCCGKPACAGAHDNYVVGEGGTATHFCSLAVVARVGVDVRSTTFPVRDDS